MYTQIKWIILFGVFSVALTDAYHILLLPTGMTPSHVNYFSKISEELTKRGHKTELVISSATAKYGAIDAWRRSATKLHTYNDKDSLKLSAVQASILDDIVKSAVNDDKDFYDKSLARAIKLYKNDVKCMLNDSKLHKIFENDKFDLVIIDGFFMTKLMYILPYKYNLPYVTLTTYVDTRLMKSPMLPSFVPHQFTDFSPEMTFMERLQNTFITIATSLSLNPTEDDELVKIYAPNKPAKTIPELVSASEFWLINANNIIDYARPLLPNMVAVGGFSMTPAKPLDGQIGEFADKATKGLVVVSFGSMVSDFPERVTKIFIEVLSQLKLQVIWKYSGEITITASNIMVVPWLPQNDLLGHKNTKLFITHCGNNGQMEGLYHGVPLLGVPLFGDQPYNAKRMEYKGYGLSIKINDITVDNFSKKIYQVIESEYILKNVNKASKILKTGKPAVEVSADWTEHILEYGGDYLKSATIHMPWYQILMLDILIFLLTIVIVIMVLFVCSVKYCYSLLPSRNNEKKVKLH